ncbi:MAG: glycosyltransferase [Candidatus Fimenecus sp.]
MKTIKYIAYYDTPDNAEQKRGYVLAATNKMDYICQALNHIGYRTEIISASGTSDTKHCYRGCLKEINPMQTLKLFFTFPWGNKIQKAVSLGSMKLFLFLELLHVKKNEKILVYHSLGYMRLVHLAHRIKRFHLILEVEEIYADVIGDTKLRNKEIEILQSADSYIFPTELLNRMLNVHNKPYVIIHGTYQVEPKRNGPSDFLRLNQENERIIHCVYAGTFDPRKGGATAAVSAAAYLPANYHIHILGFGSAEETKHIQDMITQLSERCECTVTFDGLLSGEDYIRFIQSCHIGLSTQNPDADFNATSYPCKILSYMANGLRVVSIRIPVVEESAVGDNMYYYDTQTPENIAKAILSVDVNSEYDSRKLITDLAVQFENELEKLLKE